MDLPCIVRIRGTGGLVGPTKEVHGHLIVEGRLVIQALRTTVGGPLGLLAGFD